MAKLINVDESHIPHEILVLNKEETIQLIQILTAQLVDGKGSYICPEVKIKNLGDKNKIMSFVYKENE
jgi:hypothetical protein